MARHIGAVSGFRKHLGCSESEGYACFWREQRQYLSNTYELIGVSVLKKTFRVAQIFIGVLIGFTCVTTPLSAQKALGRVALEEYGKLPEVDDVAISPSGKRVAMIREIEGGRALVAFEDQANPLRAIKINENLKVRYIRWIGEDRLLLVSSQTEDLPYYFTTDKAEFSVGRVIQVSGKGNGGLIFGKQKHLVDTIQGNYGVRKIGSDYFGFFGAMELKKTRKPGSNIPVYVFDNGRANLYKVNLRTLDAKKIAGSAEAGVWRDWVVDENGEIAFTMDVNLNSGKWAIRDRNKTTIAQGTQPRASVNLVNLNSDGTKVIFRERGEERTFWFEVGSDGAAPTSFLDNANWERLFFDSATGRFMGYTQGEDDDERHIFANKALQKKAERVRKAFAQFESRMAGWTSDLSDVLIYTSGNKDSGTYFAVNLESSRADAIAYARFAIGPEHVGAISTFAYTASDGTELDGILTLPPGREPKNLPVIIHPHGGPHSHDTARFHWRAQAFASRGYAVFQPNFRGSTNRDAAFTRAGYGEWGRKMQTDKSDGLAALAEAGIVDPDRACIVGASYGGYAALAGVTLQQGLYKCAVAVAPVSDIRDMYNQDYRASGRDRSTKVSLREQWGEPSTWDAVSPVKEAAKADAPIMLIHGVDDTVVPYSHSTKMADKLEDAGKPYELVTLDGEDHWLSLSKTRQQMLENAVRWVEKHNPPD